MVIDLAVRLGTKDIIQECSRYNCLYINTAIDIWPEDQSDQMAAFTNDEQSATQGDSVTTGPKYQSIFDIKASILKQANQSLSPLNTAILNFGANPGLVSHFAKASLV